MNARTKDLPVATPGTSGSTLQALNDWIAEVAALTRPDAIHWCDGSDAENAALIAAMEVDGTLIRLNEATNPRSWLHRSHPEDVARVDGCTEFQVLTRITLPLILPGVVASAMFTFAFRNGHAFSASQVPPPQAYFEPINWHRTALHELGHATGHPSRLNRDFAGSFGSKLYSVEEITAELISAFCCASLGIVPTVRHADYIGSWLEVLREDNRAIVRAASQASKAADWLLSFLSDAERLPDTDDMRSAA